MLFRFFPLNDTTSFDLVNAAPWGSVLQQKEHWTRSRFLWPGLPLSCHVAMGTHSPSPKMYFIVNFGRLIASECTACHVIIMQMVMMSSFHSQCWRSVDILQKHCICLCAIWEPLSVGAKTGKLHSSKKAAKWKLVSPRWIMMLHSSLIF